MAVRRRGLEFNIQGRDRTGRAFASVKRNLRDIATGAVRAAKSLAAIGTAAAAGFAVVVKRSLDAADNIAKTADKIGLSTDALQELRVAADLSGVSQRTLDLALQRFSRRVGEAAQGTGELKDTLQQYGVQLRDAEGRTRSLDAILGDYADKVAGAESEQERLRLAFKAFDSEGAALVNLLRRGSRAMEEQRQQARDLGLVIGEDLLRGAEGAKDQLTLLATVIKTKVTVEILKLAPQIQELATRFTEGLPKLIAWVRQFGEWAGLLDKIAPSKLQRVASAIEAINKAQAQGTGAFGRGPSDRGAELARRDALTRQLNDLIELQDKFDRTRIERPGLGAGGGTGGGAVDPPQVEKATAAIEQQTQALGSLTRGTQLMIERRDNLTVINAAAVETENKLARATQDLGFTFASAFEGAIVNGGKLQDVLKGILQDIVRIAARLAISEPLAGFFSGLFAPAAGAGTDPTQTQIAGGGAAAADLRIPPRTAAAANVKVEVIDRNNNQVTATANVDRGGPTIQVVLDAVAADTRRGGVTAQASRDTFGLRPLRREI